MVKLHLLFVGLATVSLMQSLSAGTPYRMAGLHCHGECHWPISSLDSSSNSLNDYALAEAGYFSDDLSEFDALNELLLSDFNANVSNRSARIIAAANDDTLGNVVDNISDPDRWTKMRYGPVQLSIAIPTAEPPTAIRFWHNGQAAHPDFVQPQSDWEAVIEDGRQLYQRSFVWSSPQLGKSNLQVEIKVGNHWSRLSQPLRLEIVPPQKPIVVAVGTHSSQLVPWDEKLGVVQCDSTLLVQLANLPAGAQVLADISGYGSLPGTVQSSDVVEFDLSKAVTSGRYRVALRYASGQSTTSLDSAMGAEAMPATMTGERSAPLWIDFYNPQQQISIDNDYAKIHHQALNAWLTATSVDPLAESLSQLATEVGGELTTTSAATLGEPLADKPHTHAHFRNLPNLKTQADEKTTVTRLTMVQSQETVPSAKGDTLATVSEVPATVSDASAISGGAPVNATAAQAVSGAAPAAPGATQPAPGATQPAPGQQSPSAAATEVHPQPFDPAIDKQIQMLNAIERVKQWKAVREQVRHAISSPEYVTDVAFDTPVTFPRRTYGPGAQEYANGGLTILEGMQLKVAANGEYCLSFSYVPPAVPCTVNLQLQFRIEEDGPWHSLTIAPMTLKSFRELDQPSNEVTHMVQGHSSTLARAAGDITAIRRRGSATFGFGHKILQSGQNY